MYRYGARGGTKSFFKKFVVKYSKQKMLMRHFDCAHPPPFLWQTTETEVQSKKHQLHFTNTLSNTTHGWRVKCNYVSTNALCGIIIQAACHSFV